MAQVLCYLPKPTDPNLLVGSDTLDDAAVYRLSDDLALVATVDFITPVVDDPYSFGAIAAANALSDVYAMGGRPLIALNLVGFPAKSLPLSVLGDILRGGAAKATEAGVTIVGGHSIDDNEPKYGLAVTGLVHPQEMVTNGGARPGDTLILTKPLGLGIITTGIDRQMVDEDTIQRAVEVMGTLNRAAAEAMVRVGVHACTDVTGFGLLGHLQEMGRASRAAARVWLPRVPVLPQAWGLAEKGVVPEGTHNNHRYLGDFVTWEKGTPQGAELVLCDAQTSGGLLIAVPPEKKEALLLALAAAQTLAAAEVGEVIEGAPGTIEVTRYEPQ